MMNMATTMPHPKFSPGDIVSYRGKSTCVVLSTTNELGFNIYHLLDLDSGVSIRSSAHEIISAVEANIINLPDIELEPTSPEKTPTKARFQLMNDGELDDLASKRTEKATDRQTSWAVKVFKGNSQTLGLMLLFTNMGCHLASSAEINCQIQNVNVLNVSDYESNSLHRITSINKSTLRPKPTLHDDHYCRYKTMC